MESAKYEQEATVRKQAFETGRDILKGDIAGGRAAGLRLIHGIEGYPELSSVVKEYLKLSEKILEILETLKPGELDIEKAYADKPRT